MARGTPAKSLTSGLMHLPSPPSQAGAASPTWAPACGGWEHPPAMSLGRLLRRASSKASDLLTLAPGGSGGPPSVLDGEIIYSKNNVCVHPPEGLQGLGEHHPGEPGAGAGRAWAPRPGGRDWGHRPEGSSLTTKPQLHGLWPHFPICPHLDPEAP